MAKTPGKKLKNNADGELNSKKSGTPSPTGKSTDPEIKRFIESKYKELFHKGSATAPAVQRAIVEEKGKKWADDNLPSMVTITKFIGAIKDSVSKSKELDETQWSIKEWKNNPREIPASHVNLILEIQSRLYSGVGLGVRTISKGHWESIRVISVREAVWISKLLDITGEVEDKYSTVHLSRIWEMAKQYSLEERVIDEKKETDTQSMDMFYYPWLNSDFSREEQKIQRRRVEHLMRFGVLKDIPAVYQTPTLTVREETHRYQPLAYTEEYEFPEVTYGLKRSAYMFKIQPSFLPENATLGPRLDIGPLIKVLENHALNRYLVFDHLAPVLPLLDELPNGSLMEKNWNPPDGPGAESYLSSELFALAVNQIPPRDKEGNYKGEYNPRRVRAAISYLTAASLHIEELLQEDWVWEDLTGLGITKVCAFDEKLVFWCLNTAMNLLILNDEYFDGYEKSNSFRKRHISHENEKTPIIIEWIYCSKCERCFTIDLSTGINYWEDEVGDFALEFYMQLTPQNARFDYYLGTRDLSRSEPSCKYEDCSGTMYPDLWFWVHREDQETFPVVPEKGVIYTRKKYFGNEPRITSRSGGSSDIKITGG